MTRPATQLPDYERLGVFYLGRRYDPAAGQPLPEPILYDSRDLTTHAVVVGMTGSGKTGMCLALIEEALLDGVPVIAIDPKGDLGNLALTFPTLAPESFRPWIDEQQALRDGLTPDALAAQTAASWRAGLAAWDQDPERIERLRAAASVRIYTPGSDAGLPLAILRSFEPPAAALASDGDLWRDRIEAAVGGLCSLIGVSADPLKSREYLLLSQLVDHQWRAGKAADLASLIAGVQRPGFETVGVFDLETFFPAAARTELALALNTLLAAPSYAAWSRGAPLDPETLLRGPDGRPQAAVISIAHLGDAERMFFVTLLLQQIVAWMRQQPGTSSLRAILYMDEVFGYLPPSAAPPSKKPLLTLLKQARAFGLGCVLATQNPVDLDYKALSNAGTWLLGRLQTERDKARVIEGLEGASLAAGRAFDRQGLESTLAGLSQRVFLLNNVHDDRPELIQSRWALSYLRGPLTRSQIGALMAEEQARCSDALASNPAANAAPAAAPTADPTSRPSGASSSARPVPPAGLEELFLADGGALRPALLGAAKVHFVQSKGDIDRWLDLLVLAPLTPSSAGDLWETAELDEPALPERARSSAPEHAAFDPLPAALDAKALKRLESGLAAWIYRSHTLRIAHCPELGLFAGAAETDAAFHQRVSDAHRARRDAASETLRQRYAPRLARLQERIRTAEAKLQREQVQAQQAQVQSAISIGATVLGALFGRKLTSASNVGRATTAARGISRGRQESQDVTRAAESIESLSAQLEQLDAECRAELAALGAVAPPTIESLVVKPRKSDISVTRIALAWLQA